MDYRHVEIEKKWQKIWEEEKTFDAHEDYSKEKYYVLVEFPYPSGEGLHVGHPRSYTALDIVARQKRMMGYNVLYPMGFDAFGLPTEKYAIKHKMDPRVVSEQNIENFKRQLKSLGFSFSWNREINTSVPSYYKWTQWIFLKLYEAGLAYKKEMQINWCPDCKIGLSNEEVVDGGCERCGTIVEHRVKNQWMLKITKYAQRLIDDLDTVDYIEKVKAQQTNWIGRSTGAEIDFKTTKGDNVKVFTTRPDTIFGSTYLVISPEHPLLEQWMEELKNKDAVQVYQKEALKKSEFERAQLVKDKTGVLLEGVEAIHPFTGKNLPIFISDYVLMTYGTGAIMSVPAHDTRDYAFAKEFHLPIIEVISGGNIEEEAYTDAVDGVLVNSDFLNGLKVPEAIQMTIQKLEEKGIGKEKVNYKLRDWVFSRQRYWGEPIPMIRCEDQWIPMDEKDLPLELPHVEFYEPTETGESPLAAIDSFVNTTCPITGKPAIRETDTMPQWAGSSWYYLRYTDPHNDAALADSKKMNYWLPVDLYNGGMEHTTLHLLYSRFWHKFLYDIGVVNTPEPYKKRISHGMILGSNGEKMSKSRGNVKNPDAYVQEYGADTLRLYEMFMGDYEKSAPWSDEGLRGARKFIERVIRLENMCIEGDFIREELLSSFHKTIKKVTSDYQSMKHNTAIAALMTLVNEIYLKESITKEEFRVLLLLLNPVAPHITEELHQQLGFDQQISQSQWPRYDEKLTIDDSIEIPVQINGKLKARLVISRDEGQSSVLDKAFELDEVKKEMDGKALIKKIYVPNKIVNLVVK
ncbi:MAG: leucine--tRNA ligase [Tissierellia bacterium]|nr:leucine--tRNA ligase [Tissierellia bacterium]